MLKQIREINRKPRFPDWMTLGVSAFNTPIEEKTDAIQAPSDKQLMLIQRAARELLVRELQKQADLNNSLREYKTGSESAIIAGHPDKPTQEYDYVYDNGVGDPYLTTTQVPQEFRGGLHNATFITPVIDAITGKLFRNNALGDFLIGVDLGAGLIGEGSILGSASQYVYKQGMKYVPKAMSYLQPSAYIDGLASKYGGQYLGTIGGNMLKPASLLGANTYAGAAANLGLNTYLFTDGVENFANNPNWQSGIEAGLGTLGMIEPAVAVYNNGFKPFAVSAYNKAEPWMYNMYNKLAAKSPIFLPVTNSYTRGIGRGTIGINDAIQTGVIRGNPRGTETTALNFNKMWEHNRSYFKDIMESTGIKNIENKYFSRMLNEEEFNAIKQASLKFQTKPSVKGITLKLNTDPLSNYATYSDYVNAIKQTEFEVGQMPSRIANGEVLVNDKMWREHEYSLPVGKPVSERFGSNSDYVGDGHPLSYWYNDGRNPITEGYDFAGSDYGVRVLNPEKYTPFMHENHEHPSFLYTPQLSDPNVQVFKKGPLGLTIRVPKSKLTAPILNDKNPIDGSPEDILKLKLDFIDYMNGPDAQFDYTNIFGNPVPLDIGNNGVLSLGPTEIAFITPKKWSPVSGYLQFLKDKFNILPNQSYSAIGTSNIFRPRVMGNFSLARKINSKINMKYVRKIDPTLIHEMASHGTDALVETMPVDKKAPFHFFPNFMEFMAREPWNSRDFSVKQAYQEIADIVPGKFRNTITKYSNKLFPFLNKQEVTTPSSKSWKEARATLNEVRYDLLKLISDDLGIDVNSNDAWEEFVYTINEMSPNRLLNKLAMHNAYGFEYKLFYDQLSPSKQNKWIKKVKYALTKPLPVAAGALYNINNEQDK